MSLCARLAARKDSLSRTMPMQLLRYLEKVHSHKNAGAASLHTGHTTPWQRDTVLVSRFEAARTSRQQRNGQRFVCACELATAATHFGRLVIMWRNTPAHVASRSDPKTPQE